MAHLCVFSLSLCWRVSLPTHEAVTKQQGSAATHAKDHHFSTGAERKLFTNRDRQIPQQIQLASQLQCAEMWLTTFFLR